MVSTWWVLRYLGLRLSVLFRSPCVLVTTRVVEVLAVNGSRQLTSLAVCVMRRNVSLLLARGRELCPRSQWRLKLMVVWVVLNGLSVLSAFVKCRSRCRKLLQPGLSVTCFFPLRYSRQ